MLKNALYNTNHMKTYKITWYKGFYLDPSMSGDNLIRANSEEEAISIFNSEYLEKGRIWDSIADCSSIEYQLAYDSENFDSNGRRKF